VSAPSQAFDEERAAFIREMKESKERLSASKRSDAVGSPQITGQASSPSDSAATSPAAADDGGRAAFIREMKESKAR
jgi:hypothetical protein